MFKPTATALLTSLIALSGPVWAQSTAPGLWQIENKVGGNPEMERAMAQMQAQLAAMPPAQRKQMETMMGKSGASMGIGMGAGGAVAVKVCITPEMASRQQLPSQTQGNCTSKIVSRSASSLKMAFACTNPTSTGEGIYTFTGDKAYTVKMAIQGASQGKPQNITMDGKAQWLAADCGAVKPIALPTQ